MKWLKHPLMPMLLFVIISQVTGESYPFSRYAMYSNPSPEPLRFQFLADSSGTPVPTREVLGLSSTSLMKMISGVEGKMERDELKEAKAQGRPVRSERELRVIAAENVLDYARDHAAGKKAKKGKRRTLPDHLMMMENTVSVENGRLLEKIEMLAERKP
jgi:hypothetical protein